MPITAKFQADFSDFTAETQKAESELQRLEQQADRTQTSINQIGAGGGDPFHTFNVSAVEADHILSDLHVEMQKTPSLLTELRSALNGVAEEAGVTFQSLGLLGTAGAIFGAAIAGWGIGRAIADFFHLDDAIGKVTASVLDWGNVAAETGAAKQEVLTRATLASGSVITDYSEAIKINQAALEGRNEGLARARVEEEATQAVLRRTIDLFGDMDQWSRQNTARIEKENAAQRKSYDELAKFILDNELKMHEASDRTFEDSQKVAAAMNDIVIAEFKAGEQIKAETVPALDAQTAALDRLLQKQNALLQLEATTGFSTKKQQVLVEQEIQKTLDGATGSTEKATKATQGLNQETANVPPVFNAATQAVASFANGLAAVPTATNGILRDLFGRPVAGQGATTIEHSSLPTRAGGGDVSAGQTYLVGERGPELFMPGSSGSISPSGGLNVAITINGSVLGNKDEIARAVSDALTRVLKSGTKLGVS